MYACTYVHAYVCIHQYDAHLMTSCKDWSYSGMVDWSYSGMIDWSYSGMVDRIVAWLIVWWHGWSYSGMIDTESCVYVHQNLFFQITHTNISAPTANSDSLVGFQMAEHYQLTALSATASPKRPQPADVWPDYLVCSCEAFLASVRLLTPTHTRAHT